MPALKLPALKYLNYKNAYRERLKKLPALESALKYLNYKNALSYRPALKSRPRNPRAGTSLHLGLEG